MRNEAAELHKAEEMMSLWCGDASPPVCLQSEVKPQPPHSLLRRFPLILRAGRRFLLQSDVFFSSDRLNVFILLFKVFMCLTEQNTARVYNYKTYNYLLKVSEPAEYFI